MDLKEKAKAALEYNTDYPEVTITSDGNPFRFKTDALAHIADTGIEKNYKTFTREDIFGEQADTDLDWAEGYDFPKEAKALVEFIKIQEDVELLQAIQEHDKRKTVQAAVSERLAQLEG